MPRITMHKLLPFLVQSRCTAGGDQSFSRFNTFVCGGALRLSDSVRVPGWFCAAVGSRSSRCASFQAEELEDGNAKRRIRLEDLKPGEEVFQDAQIGKETVVWQTGKLARLADAACVCSIGGTQVLTTVVRERSKSAVQATGMIPLQVDYRERMSSVGRIPLTFNRREGSPKDREIVAARAIDRAIRPLFPVGFSNETQVMATVLSADGTQDPDVTAINAASAALMLSNIPWNGPIGAIRIGYKNEKFILNPSTSKLEESDLRLTVAGTSDRVVMLECQANQVDDRILAKAMRLAQSEIVKLIEPQKLLTEIAGKDKEDFETVAVDPYAYQRVEDIAEPMLRKAFQNPQLGKKGRSKARNSIARQTHEALEEMGAVRGDLARVPGSGCVSPSDLELSLTMLEAKIIREMALSESTRVDGRGLLDLRPIYCEVECTHMVHGSSLFQRGETQCLSTVTVGGDQDIQNNESILGELPKHLLVHYSFPPFSNCEVSRFGGASRREIGHGILAERALECVMPEKDGFPFPVRINADTLGSNGSSSMAAVCGSCLALKDAGVPIKALVAGVSVGLVMDQPPSPTVDMSGERVDLGLPKKSRYSLLVDLQGLEDYLGDMDFKVAGTVEGVTAAHLDVKIPGVSIDILIEALALATSSRRKILETMENCLPTVFGPNSPRFGTIEVNKDLVGYVIGEGGETIRRIESDSGARLVMKVESNEVRVYAPTQDQYKQAETAILDVQGANIREGELYTVRVVRIMDFGAFVELPSGFQTLLHISDLSHAKIRAVEEVLYEGQEIKVKCLGRDPKGNVRISRKALQPLPYTSN